MFSTAAIILYNQLALSPGSVWDEASNQLTCNYWADEVIQDMQVHTSVGVYAILFDVLKILSNS